MTDLSLFGLKGKVKVLTEYSGNKADIFAITKTVTEFDTAGRFLYQSIYDSGNPLLLQKTVAIYDSAGRRVRDERQMRFSPDSMIHFVALYRYDGHGKKMAMIEKLPAGDSLVTLFEYDQTGKIIKEEKKEREGKIYQITEFKYDKNGHKAQKISKQPGASGMNMKYVYVYNKDGQVELEDWYHLDGTRMSQMNYDYRVGKLDYKMLGGPGSAYIHDLFFKSSELPAMDKHGNWICRKMISDGSNVIGMETRLIEYY